MDTYAGRQLLGGIFKLHGQYRLVDQFSSVGSDNVNAVNNAVLDFISALALQAKSKI